MSFKDFPLIDPNMYENKHVHNQVFFKYLKDYANHFDLVKHIVFESQVLKVSKLKDEWEVKVKIQNEEEIHFFDYVIVCIGHNHDPWIPTEDDGIKDLNEF